MKTKSQIKLEKVFSTDEVTPEMIAPYVTYDPETGIFYWGELGRPGRYGFMTSLAGKPCGYVDPRGYVTISVKGVRVYAHRLAWFLTHGEFVALVDHINRDPSDNRISNLRPATMSQNARNSRLYSTNKSGVKGVWMESKCPGSWRVAIINLAGKAIGLGSYKSFETAVAVRKAAEALIYGKLIPG